MNFARCRSRGEPRFFRRLASAFGGFYLAQSRALLGLSLVGSCVVSACSSGVRFQFRNNTAREMTVVRLENGTMTRTKAPAESVRSLGSPPGGAEVVTFAVYGDQLQLLGCVTVQVDLFAHDIVDVPQEWIERCPATGFEWPRTLDAR